MYNSLCNSKLVQKDITYINHEIYGLEIRPLKDFIEKPDIVIMITNPYQSMRIIQGYTYQLGVHKNIKIAGNQVFCSECTATPYESNDLNISMLCSGTRYFAKWDNNEMTIGIPYNKQVY
ncbi:hypothetical protein CLPU_7c00230 [Gottschalkia purinilytica]|uniref:Uncharacterized protein n=1 Tax=Gottschalkia purinilytica TaxID=1503 RepID=A0A0L0WAN8_GOTPU|nr:DUF169 domain-containing protein [Gottschalkia purinilytica]KNF08395.1 hypothetical protein CLPU_7c00230 [Gottschalkia purinilytica]